MSIRAHKAVSLLLCLLVVSATAGVAVAIPEPYTSTTTDSDPEPQSSLTERRLAQSILLEASLSKNPVQKDALLEKLKQTSSLYLDGSRVSDGPFAVDREIARKTKKDAPEVGSALATSDRLLASQAIDDARLVHRRLSTNESVDYETAAVVAHIEKAEQQLAAAEEGRRKAPAAKIRHYQIAWNHAQAALDILDRATTPTVTIDNREDPPHSDAIAYRINGTVTDVRTHQIESVTIHFEDGTTKAVPVTSGAGPFATGRFDAVVTLEKPINTITVTATNENDPVASSPPASNVKGESNSGNAVTHAKSANHSSSEKPGKRAEKGRNANSGTGGNTAPSRNPAPTASQPERPPSSSTPENSTGSATLLLDADGLPDTYERNVTQTDPLSPDSDSGRTDQNEAGNRIIDGAEDFDNDSVQTYTEYVHGLDPFDSDTDDDELTDRFELDYAGLDPAVADTDGDGVLDGQDDNDGEGLVNVREQRHATNPNRNDTDRDSLTDKYEVDTTLTDPLQTDSDSARTGSDEAGNGIVDNVEDFDNDTLQTGLEADIATDPFDVDTDDDRLTDAFEHRYRTLDPTTNDTDDDGVLDAQEDPDNETLVNLHEQQNGTSPTDPDTDNDRLDDAYELRVAGTVPTNPDSNSSVTSRSEAGDGIVDGLEDFDGESLVTHVEAGIGTDPFDVDTDDDDLTDAFEHRFSTVDPLLADTDGDGVPDAREDPDNETLINVHEQANGTIPTNPDTDADNLTDAEEIRDALTNPLVDDSDSARTNVSEANNSIVDGSEDFDNDGLSAAVEYELGTDPFDPDTDDDGLLDGFEHRYATMDPLVADTDGDGVLDAQEDPDNETLVNVDEQAAGTSPLDADSDDDDLTDAFELRRSLTSPLDVDSDSTGTNATEANNTVTDAAEDFDGDGLSTVREQALGTDPLAVDSDGDALSDAQEVETTLTDPLAADSDSTATSANESGNGIVDGGEDFDGDTVVNAAEFAFGTDPFAVDTDGDQLRDGFEVRYSGFNATRMDSNGDGVVDAETDTDNDTLTALEEQAIGTTPLSNDTDFDTLGDAAEVQVHDTNPVAPDTDRDGLRDDEELALGTDPRLADTDGDGVVDGNETFTTSTTNESLGASVSTTGEGNLAAQIVVEQGGDPALNVSTVQEAAASEAVTVRAGNTVHSATLDLSYNESAVEFETDLAVYRYDREAHTMRKVKTSVDTEANTVSGTVSGTGTYVVLSQTDWERNFEGDLPEDHSETSEFGNTSRWDCSGTDAQCDGDGESLTIGKTSLGTSSFSASSTPLTYEGESTSTDSDTDVSILCYTDGQGNFYCPGDPLPSTPTPTPTSTPTDAPEPDPDPNPGGGSGDPTDPVEPEEVSNSTYAAAFEFPDAEDISLSAAFSLQSADDDAYASVRIIGESGTERLASVSGTGDEATFNRHNYDLDRFAGERVIIHIVALNESAVTVDRFRLTYDTDGDGLSDSVERGGIRTSMGTTVYTNPYRSDSDGDGLSDSYEAGHRSSGVYGAIYNINSDPTKFDTDGDGLGDYEETYTARTVMTTTTAKDSRQLTQLDEEAGAEAVREYVEKYSRLSDPRNADSDGDGLSDTREIALSTDPTNSDTDHDGVTDGDEVEYWESDPTMHDYRPPEVTVHRAQFESPDFGLDGEANAEYAFLYSVEDPSGVDQLSFRKEGQVEHRIDLSGGQNIGGNTYFTSDAWDSVFDSITGATIYIHAVDTHGNEQRIIGFEQANFYGQLADEIDYTGAGANYVANGLGLLSGVSSSLASIRGSAESIAKIVNNPVEYLKSFREVIKLLDQLGMLDQIVDQMIGEFKQKMKQNNPYAATTEERLYEAFKDGWYSGYVVGFLMKVALGYAAAKALKATTVYTKVAKFVDSTTAGRIAFALQGRIDAAQLRLATTLASGSLKVGKAGIRGAKTVGSAVRVYSRSLRLDFDTRDLSSVQQANLRRHLLGDDDAISNLNRMSDEERRQLLSLGRSCSRTFSAGLTTLNKGCDPDAGAGIDQIRTSHPETVHRLAEYRRNGFFSQTDIERFDRALANGKITGGELRQLTAVLETKNEKLRLDGGVPDKQYDDLYEKILEGKDDWDHDQVGTSKDEIGTRTNKVLDDPDTVYKDADQNRWLFVKTLEIDGEDVTLTMYLTDNRIATVYAPTEPGRSGLSAHTDDWIETHIRDQGMIKYYQEDQDSSFTEEGVGEVAE